MNDPILQTRGLSKSFNGFSAVDGVDLSVRRGSIHALIGPNGAGKTTCFNLLTKFLRPTTGQIIFDGIDVTKDTPVDVARRGVVRSFQISAVFPDLTASENVRIALQRQLPSYRFWVCGSRLECLNERASELLEEVDLAAFAGTKAAELSYGRKRALELATTLAMDPRLMLLDEPTQGMGVEDVERTRELIRQAARGRTILMVEHNMSVVASLADQITVLARGAVLTEGSYEEVSKHPRVVEAYLGRPRNQHLRTAT